MKYMKVKDLVIDMNSIVAAYTENYVDDYRIKFLLNDQVMHDICFDSIIERDHVFEVICAKLNAWEVMV